MARFSEIYPASGGSTDRSRSGRKRRRNRRRRRRNRRT